MSSHHPLPLAPEVSNMDQWGIIEDRNNNRSGMSLRVHRAW